MEKKEQLIRGRFYEFLTKEDLLIELIRRDTKEDALSEDVALNIDKSIQVGTILYTKDGRNIGNAIVIDRHPKTHRFTIKTDYGNVVRNVSNDEIRASWFIGESNNESHKYFKPTEHEMKWFVKVSKTESLAELADVIREMADEDGMVKGRTQNFKASQMAACCETYSIFKHNTLTREYFIRQQAMYILFYDKLT